MALFKNCEIVQTHWVKAQWILIVALFKNCEIMALFKNYEIIQTHWVKATR